ncbi:hypothetical protein BAE46_08455 [Glaciecola punicea]|jgi:hypothetical protein|nr:hypothetical protein [Glaciecola punicea]OFA31715.1 hypothetical protein BAE46_08455 [Glaciecola punicea]
MNKLVFVLCATFLFTGCDDKDKDDTVLVYKYKGSVQCDVESGVPLDNMLSELIDANINVICSSEGNDGNVVVAVCGAETGVINVYEIPISSLITAENLGFNNVQLLEDAIVVMDCE